MFSNHFRLELKPQPPLNPSRHCSIRQMAMEMVEAVRFSFLTDEEVKRHSFGKITNPDLFQGNIPSPGGLYDPALGPLDDESLCKSCGLRSYQCPGHCGHIDLVLLSFNPLLLNMLYNLLRKTCFFCHHFRAPEKQVKTCVLMLELILKGDIVGARRLLDTVTTVAKLKSTNRFNYDERLSELSEDSDSCLQLGEQSRHSNCLDQQEWTSLQLTESMSVLNNFLKKKSKKCARCNARNPTITKPSFGLINMNLSDADANANVLAGCVVNGPSSVEDDEKSASEVDNADDPFSLESMGANGERTPSATESRKKIASAKWKRKKGEEPAEHLKQKKSLCGFLLPSKAREIMELLWENEPQLCSFIGDIQQQQPYGAWKNAGYSMFFLKTVLVPPTKFRPPAKGADSMVIEHPQTVLLARVVEANLSLGNACEQHAQGSKIVRLWMNLQQSINVLFVGKAGVGQGKRDMGSGICQLLEKKDGVFRQKMMGKRVNFACRSVISPDPYLAVDEIGIPPCFALKLTYPESVTPWNVVVLRDAIVNGPEIHPGATHYVDKLANVKLPLSKKMRIAISRKLPSSRGVVVEPLKSWNYEFEGKVVKRHMRNGDIVLVNRQPTLHKPSIVALRVRVLPGEKTLRMHYANCDSFNADFDGDEINVHFPQDEISRAEAYHIVNANDQYIVPTRGDPKRALIQDHIVSAVLLTKRDTFLTQDEFTEILYSSGLCASGSRFCNVKLDRRVSVVNSEDLIMMPLPAIIKPRQLWTGKQIITAILDHLTRGCMPFTVKKRARIAREYFGKDDSKKKTDELSKSKNYDSEMKSKIDGVSKKKIDGELVEQVHEASGKRSKIHLERRSKLDSDESTDEDMVFVYKNELVQGVIDKEQFGKYGLVHTVQELYGSEAAGNLLSVLGRVLTSFLQIHGFTCGVDDLLLKRDYDKLREQLLDASLNCGKEVHMQFIGRKGKQLDFDDIQTELENAIRRNGESAIALLDGMMRNKLNSSNSALSKLFPDGLIKPFRQNCLSLMTLSGAKGGMFNFQQISLLLGQQELEGKRVPRMVSGKTLPCFPSWDITARAGGFIADRYLTGLRPQEFYFHCMAGREGLVDTAVKTSRSGYLQRCLIKNLESLKVHYDYTVRDADGSIVQFRYGEDGVDIHQKNFIEEFEGLAVNQEIIRKNLLSQIDDVCISKYVKEDNEYPDELAKKAEDFLTDDGRARIYGLQQQKDCKNFVKLVKNKYFLSLAQPGEPVGVIAAQSIGEPSTQMTLNTFHHAGRGEMNVTLGIPRLQEILMTASTDIKTPTMTCPLHKLKSRDDAEHLAAKLKRITVADLIEKIEVCVVPFTISDHQISSIYKLKIKLYEPKLYPPHTDISTEDTKETLEGVYLRKLEDTIQNHLLLLSKISGIKNFMSDSHSKASNEADEDAPRKYQRDDDDDDDDDVGNEEEADDLGSDMQKRKQQRTDEIDYEDISEDELEEGNRLAEDESEVDQAEEKDDGENLWQDEPLVDANEDAEAKNLSKTESQKKKDKSESRKGKKAKAKKESDRAIYVAAEGLHFEVHFRLINEPHLLLTEIAQQTAKAVHVKSSGKIDQCQVVELHLDDLTKVEAKGIPMLRKGKQSRHGLQTSGVEFATFWGMQDDLDVNCISSNDIHAMLNTYGVEAARATIITEVFRVFNHYGVSVDMRHLTLIADFMTHSGGYRPMSRSGGIAESVSPFAKMSFETASKFIVEAASRGEVDNLETPSARICLGLPAKVGTGSFDLMQELDVLI
ncbi:hypothetical protein Nepgr_010021 [Nepenthes gracilis]|uniref:DNA-directed RNA polymerase subunit n=1 Tax=Nepenthes gracilis TaxID=150966 RepID=A0AAD3SCB3_NEPGR|nr:hypothetical protein Nepgr_010021 [Nepenthes gracilis]